MKMGRREREREKSFSKNLISIVLDQLFHPIDNIEISVHVAIHNIFFFFIFIYWLERRQSLQMENYL